jgi:hypothetical protein
MVNIKVPMRGNWVMKTRYYEGDLAKIIGGTFRNRKLYDILEGRTRYEVKKQQHGNWIDMANAMYYFKVLKRYRMLWLYYNKDSKEVYEVYFVKPLELLVKLGFTRYASISVKGTKKCFPKAQVKVPVSKSIIEEVAYKKVSM